MQIKPFIKILILYGILFAFGIYPTIMNFKTNAGVDFYQFWGVSTAHKLSDGALKSPYAEIRKYSEVLYSYANNSHDERLQVANLTSRQLYKAGLDLNGTPLLHFMYECMPQDFTLAFGIFQFIQLLLFVSALVLVYAIKQVKFYHYAIISIILVQYYGPFLSDLRVGNLNSVQFFAITAITFFFDRFLKKGSTQRTMVYGAVFMCSLIFLTLLKPNLVLVTLLLSVSLWSLHGAKVLALSTAISGIFGSILMTLPCLYFGSWVVWMDWYRYFSHISKNPYPPSSGNFATSIIVASILNVNTDVITVLIVAALFGHGLWVLLKSRSRHETLWQYLHVTTISLFQEPLLILALAITTTLAISPLAWFHYFVLSLIPALWLISISSSWSYPERLGLLSVVLTSNIVPYAFEWENVDIYTVAAGWIPLWLGITAVIRDKIKGNFYVDKVFDE